ncbi:histidine phosphatase family protein [Roseococcus sp. YIM B11640]|uniref:histidine phosphatase family protein n=1 Tax=Roseococcus sp. YIM B11640 TaxID=3133973 RepID=UPI003C7B421C
MDVTRFTLVRHALVEVSARAVIYGSMDVPLCDTTVQGEADLYRWLAARLPRPAHWVATSLVRTQATAAAIFAAGYPDQELQLEPALAEQSMGEWQGATHDDFATYLSLPPHPFWPHAAAERPPGGESFDDLRDRVAPVMERLARDFVGQDVVIVAHGGSIRAALAHALRLDAHQALHFSIKNLSVTRLEKHGPDWRVGNVNEEPWVMPDVL